MYSVLKDHLGFSGALDGLRLMSQEAEQKERQGLSGMPLRLFSCSLVSDSLRPHGLQHGIFQARILEWVAISYSRGSPQTRDQSCVSCIGKWILYH